MHPRPSSAEGEEQLARAPPPPPPPQVVATNERAGGGGLFLFFFSLALVRYTLFSSLSCSLSSFDWLGLHHGRPVPKKSVAQLPWQRKSRLAVLRRRRRRRRRPWRRQRTSLYVTLSKQLFDIAFLSMLARLRAQFTTQGLCPYVLCCLLGRQWSVEGRARVRVGRQRERERER